MLVVSSPKVIEDNGKQNPRGLQECLDKMYLAGKQKIRQRRFYCFR